MGIGGFTGLDDHPLLLILWEVDHGCASQTIYNILKDGTAEQGGFLDRN